MNKKFILPALMVIAGCSSTSQRPQEVEAVRDFIAAADLKEVSEIRMSRQLSYTYLNDRFVLMPTRRGDYLVEFNRACWELRENRFTPEMVDVRDNQNILRARYDTLRGCRIDTMYEITEEQREELKDLGDAPGDEVFLPEEE